LSRSVTRDARQDKPSWIASSCGGMLLGNVVARGFFCACVSARVFCCCVLVRRVDKKNLLFVPEDRTILLKKTWRAPTADRLASSLAYIEATIIGINVCHSLHARSVDSTHSFGSRLQEVSRVCDDFSITTLS
jgi:hypothetical protein